MDGKINHLGRDFCHFSHRLWHSRIARLLGDGDGLALRFQDGLLAGFRPHLDQDGRSGVIIEEDLIRRYRMSSLAGVYSTSIAWMYLSDVRRHRDSA